MARSPVLRIQLNNVSAHWLVYQQLVFLYLKIDCTLYCIAAGEIRVLTSPRLISEVLNVGQREKGPITIADVLEVLRLQISVVECDIFAYPSIESDLVLLVMPVTKSPTSLQVLAGVSFCCFIYSFSRGQRSTVRQP